MKETRHETQDLETIFKWQGDARRARMMRELLILFVMLIGFALGLMAFGFVQYWTCTLRDPNITAMQCFRAEKASRREREK